MSKRISFVPRGSPPRPAGRAGMVPTPRRSLRSLLIAAAVLALTSVAAADTTLTTTVFTASPNGFLVTSTLIAGEKEAILVDGQFTLADAHRVVAGVLESKKTLTTVYVSHGHPDHYFGLEVIKQAFPKAKLVALPATIADIKKTWKAKVKQWGPMYGAQVTSKPTLPTAMKGTTFTLEGQTIEVKTGRGDDANNTYLWIPSTKTVIAGDIVFAGVHPWTAEGNAEARTAWIKTLDEITALAPTTVVAGHKDPAAKDDLAAVKSTKEYLQAFDTALTASKSAEELEKKMKAKYKDYKLDVILTIGAGAQFPAPAAATPTTPTTPTTK
jgi:glyoxylase-like metal-dependent hydrolase (beta-lactamase superfamily II)